VEDWEAKAPLDDVEVRSVLSLKIRCEEKKPPLKVSGLNFNIMYI
jgi:hypothetical protein